MVIGLVFPKSDQDALLRGVKTAIIIDGDVPFRVGESYPAYISDGDDPFKDSREKRIGEALILEITQKKISDISEKEIILSHNDFKKVEKMFRDNGDSSPRGFPVTWMRFEMSFNWRLAKTLVSGVEIKCTLSDDNLKTLDKAGDLISERIIIDTYFDDPDFGLAKKNWWLINRWDEGWRLRMPANFELIDIFNEESIKHWLHMADFDEISLMASNYKKKIATITWKRKSYRLGDFLIEADIVDMQDMRYHTGKISPLVMRGQSFNMECEIYEFCSANGFDTRNSRRKIMEYFRLNDPDLYHELVDAGVPE